MLQMLCSWILSFMYSKNVQEIKIFPCTNTMCYYIYSWFLYKFIAIMLWYHVIIGNQCMQNETWYINLPKQFFPCKLSFLFKAQLFLEIQQWIVFQFIFLKLIRLIREIRLTFAPNMTTKVTKAKTYETQRITQLISNYPLISAVENYLF